MKCRKYTCKTCKALKERSWERYFTKEEIEKAHAPLTPEQVAMQVRRESMRAVQHNMKGY